MKKLFYLFILLSFMCEAQNCKFKKNEIDDFTKEKRLLTENKIICFDFYENSIGLTFSKFKTNLMSMKISFAGHDVILINENQKISLLLTDKSVIDLKIEDLQSGKLKGNGGLMSSTDFEFFFDLNDELIKHLKQGVVKIRINTMDGFKDFDVKEKKYKKMLETLNCFLEESKK
ncbi:hypothetical protein [Flavobacterium sp. HNIBRBA15423]|uniref:hypothetical protein n=1 Tax=Flavobacterium sp. HNIBRBA15423 TaxID=3458683 RepID=UPI004043D611